MSKLFDEVSTYLRAGFPAVWIDSFEPHEAIRDIVTELNTLGAPWMSYDIADGVSLSKPLAPIKAAGDAKDAGHDKPTRVMRAIPTIYAELVKYDSSMADRKMVVIIENAHFDALLGKAQVHVQLMSQLFIQAKQTGFAFVFTGQSQKIPAELSRSIVVVSHALPDSAELLDLAAGVDPSVKQDSVSAEDRQSLLEAASGLTRDQAENAFALSIIRTDKLDPEVVWDVKSQEVKKSGLLEIYAGTDKFADIGGNEGFKDFALSILARRFEDHRLRPKGLLLLGVPGAGKSAVVKCLGNETGREVLLMDMGSLRSKYQGESENNFNHALHMADSMEPCILFLDELEKALAGVSGTGETDGGTTMRVFGSFLTWLNDHTSDVLVIGTCNDISSLPDAFSRAERFDGIFFFDVPSAQEREAIWTIYLNMFHDGDLSQLAKLVRDSVDWTGAEIRSACRLAKMLNKPIETVMPLVPIYAQRSPKQLGELRSYAEQHCLSASVPNSRYIKPRPPKLDLNAPKRKIIGNRPARPEDN